MIHFLDYCTNPPSISDGSYSPVSSLFNVGDVIVYRCNNALILIGNAKSSCMAKGTWPLNNKKKNLPICCKL